MVQPLRTRRHGEKGQHIFTLTFTFNCTTEDRSTHTSAHSATKVIMPTHHAHTHNMYTQHANLHTSESATSMCCW